MKGLLAWVAPLLLATVAVAQDKPLVYDHVAKVGQPEDAIDQSVNAALGTKYSIKEIEDSPAYTNVKATRGSAPTSAKSDSGEELTGYVLVAYVVAADGTAADPVVIKTTNDKLNKFALGAVAEWRFEPARLNGAAIATTAAQEFNFKVPAGFQVANIVLYQPNAVLEARMPAVEKLSDYIKHLEAVGADFFAADTVPETLHIVMVVKPGLKARAWFVSSIRDGSDPSLAGLRQKLEAIAPIEVKDGPLAFAISSNIAGGDGKNPTSGKNFQPPIPTEWSDAAKGKSVTVPDGLIEAVWPE